MAKKWSGKWYCDGCGRNCDDPEGDGILYDARSKSGPWGVFCSQCFKEMCLGIGTGFGQKYEFNGREFIKIAG